MTSNQLYGLLLCAVMAILLYSIFVPMTNLEPGDGFFVQFCVDFGIFLVGIFVNMYVCFPTFHSLAMVGGALWAFGWATSRFGLFGTEARQPSNPGLNYAGLILVLIGGIFFAMVEPTPKKLQRKQNAARKTYTVGTGISQVASCSTTKRNTITIVNRDTADNETNCWDLDITVGVRGQNAVLGKVNGVVVAVISGLFFGSIFTPTLYIQYNHPDKFANVTLDNPYADAHFKGHLLMGLLILVCYKIFKRNRPFINNEIMMPAIIGGAMWGIGCTDWFMSSNYLSQAVSFPINTMVPACCSMLWSALLFREIRGARNYIVAGLGLSITILGAIMATALLPERI